MVPLQGPDHHPKVTVRDNGHVLEDANTAQLAEGLDADNRDITPEYAPLTIEIKQQKGQKTDCVTRYIMIGLR